MVRARPTDAIYRKGTIGELKAAMPSISVIRFQLSLPESFKACIRIYASLAAVLVTSSRTRMRGVSSEGVDGVHDVSCIASRHSEYIRN